MIGNSCRPKPLQFAAGRRELSFAAINNDQIGQAHGDNGSGRGSGG